MTSISSTNTMIPLRDHPFIKGLLDSLQFSKFKRLHRDALYVFSKCMLMNGLFYLFMHLLYSQLHTNAFDASIYYIAWFIPYTIINMLYNIHYVGILVDYSIHKAVKKFSIDKYLTDFLISRIMIALIYGILFTMSLFTDVISGWWIYITWLYYPVYWACLLYMNVYYIYEIIIGYRGGDLIQRCIFIEQHWMYLFGFALIPTMLTQFFSATTGFILFYLLYPIYVFLALNGTPVKNTTSVNMFYLPFYILNTITARIL